MAILNFTGFETGSSTYPDYGASGLLGTASSYSTSGPRTGSYAMRVNRSSTQEGYIDFNQLSANGLFAALTGYANIYVGAAYRFVSFPAIEEVIMHVQGSGVNKSRITINSSGQVSIRDVAHTLIVTGNTRIPLGTYVYIEVRVGTGVTGNYEIKINEVIEVSGTANFGVNNTDSVLVGTHEDMNGGGFEYFVDDAYLSDSDFLSSGSYVPAVSLLVPNAAGDSAGWTNGTGSTFAEVDEIPPESDGADASYIQASAAQDNTYSAFNVQAPFSMGISNGIHSVKGMVVCRTTSTSGNSTVSLRMRLSATNSDTTGKELILGYDVLQKLHNTSFVSALAWTITDLESLQIGMSAAAIGQVQRFTAAYIMVLHSILIDPVPGRPYGRIGQSQMQQLIVQ